VPYEVLVNGRVLRQIDSNFGAVVVVNWARPEEHSISRWLPHALSRRVLSFFDAIDAALAGRNVKGRRPTAEEYLSGVPRISLGVTKLDKRESPLLRCYLGHGDKVVVRRSKGAEVVRTLELLIAGDTRRASPNGKYGNVLVGFRLPSETSRIERGRAELRVISDLDGYHEDERCELAGDWAVEIAISEVSHRL